MNLKKEWEFFSWNGKNNMIGDGCINNDTNNIAVDLSTPDTSPLKGQYVMSRSLCCLCSESIPWEEAKLWAL